MAIGQRIRSRRKSLDLTVDDLANQLGKNRATIYRYENNDIENLPISIIEPLADVLKTTPGYLMGWTDDPYNYDIDEDNRFNLIPTDIFKHLMNIYHDDCSAVWKAYRAMEKDSQKEAQKMRLPSNALPLPHMKQIPLYDGIACGEPIRAEQNTVDIINCPVNITADFALICHGDSMINARIFDGDVVLIKSQQTVENGEIAAIEIEDENDTVYDATLKRFYSDGKQIWLHAENPTIPDRYFIGEDMNKVHIAGKAVYFISKVR